MAPTRNALRKLTTDNENILLTANGQSNKPEILLNGEVPLNATIANMPRKTASRNRGSMQQHEPTATTASSLGHIIQTRAKRKRDTSPNNENCKRAVLGNLTNKANLVSVAESKDENAKVQKITKTATTTATSKAFRESQNLNGGQQQQQQQHVKQTKVQQEAHKITTRSSANRVSQNASVTTKHDKILLDAELMSTVQVKNDIDLVLLPPPAAPMVHANAAAAHASLALKKDSKPVRRISNEFNKTEESLYMSALEEVSFSDSVRLSGNFEAAKRRSQLLQNQKKESPKLKKDAEEKENESVPDKDPMLVAMEMRVKHDAIVKPYRSPPDTIDDFDKANWSDPFQVSHYAMEIFEYMKDRECHFTMDDYMKRQVHLSIWMRSLLIDWMVEVQETFELNHETLYLAVKIVDMYLSRVVIHKDKLQLLGAAALFIACKYDERIPPLIEDFLYICDGAYKHDELIKMEQHTFRTIDYELGMPLSYRFLRRYARCARIPMTTLTLARYILELSLMDYATVGLSDSRLAAASLFMALRMSGHKIAWTPTLQYYSGYALVDFGEMVPILNAGLRRKPKSTIKTIRTKYSHKIFHEVSKVPLMTNEKLFEDNLDANFSLNASNSTLEKSDLSHSTNKK